MVIFTFWYSIICTVNREQELLAQLLDTYIYIYKVAGYLSQ